MPNDENFGYRKVPIEYRRSKFIRTDGISQEMPAPKDWTNDLTVIVESTNRMDGSFEEDQKMARSHRKFVNCTSTIAKIRYGGLDNAADQIGRFRPPYCFYPFPKTRNPPTTSRPREPAKADFALVHFHG